MVSLARCKSTMYVSCSTNVFRPHELKKRFQGDPEDARAFKARFEVVLREKPFTAKAWEDEFDTSFDEEEEVQEHLQAIYDYLFLDCPMP